MGAAGAGSCTPYKAGAQVGWDGHTRAPIGCRSTAHVVVDLRLFAHPSRCIIVCVQQHVQHMPYNRITHIGSPHSHPTPSPTSDQGAAAAWPSLQQRAQQHGAAWWPEAVSRRLAELQHPMGPTASLVAVQWPQLLATVQGVALEPGAAALQALLQAPTCNAAALMAAAQELKTWLTKVHVPASAAPTAAKQRAGVFARCVWQCCEGNGVEAAWRASLCVRQVQLLNIDRETRCALSLACCVCWGSSRLYKPASLLGAWVVVLVSSPSTHP